MLALILNCCTILLGGSIGLLFRRVLKKEIFEEVLKVVGLTVIIFGALGLFQEMLFIEDGNLKARHELLLLVALALGAFLGTVLKLDFRLKKLTKYLDEKFKGKRFSEGFITATMVFGSGAMAIVGSIRAGLGDLDILYLKAVIDGITALILASTLGYGVLFSIVPIFFYQGLFVLLTSAFGNFFPNDFISAFSAIGYALLVAIGINFIFENKIKVINLIPALGICILWFVIKSLL
ncbi:MAG TPA: DUF554 domain-containing protein [Acholeplasmataceae bacterium]|jgi:uncharacterized membrane protein YqgA involved in biofilm formation|nr:DUF554 domain-containing protein [Acholeplasmataceae bacterium]